MIIAHIGSKRIAKVTEYTGPTNDGFVAVEIVGVTVQHREYKTRNGNIKSSLDISYTVETIAEQAMYKDAPVGDRAPRYAISHEDLN